MSLPSSQPISQRHSASKRLVLMALALGVLLAGCGREAVRASEKEFLADRIMTFDDDPQATAADSHIESNREGAAGGAGTSGGGCGCN